MNSKPSPEASMFEKVLRAFETRGITYSDVLARLRRLLATGALPKELLVILRRRESTERMPEYARIEALLVEAMERAAQNASQDLAPNRIPDPVDSDDSAPAAPSTVVSMPTPPPGPAIEPEPHEDEVVVDLDFNAPGRDLDLRRGLRASELDLSALAKHLRSVEQRTPARGANLEALTRSYERAKEGESAAAERAASLAADLQAAHTSLDAEQGKLREIEQTLAESVASEEAAREAALREAQLRRSEVSSLRATVAERDAALEQFRQALTDREAQIASLSRDRTAVQTAREAAAILPAAIPPAATAPAANPSAAKPVPQRRHSGWLGGPTRAISWSAAAALVLAGLFWLFVQRSSTRPAPAPSAAVPIAGTAIRDCPTCPEMTVLPAGRFKQGSAGAPGYEQPLHWVVIGHPIAMSTAPVTVENFEQFVTATGRDMQGCDTYDGEWKHRPADSWQQPGFAQTGTHPVTCVSWNDAEAYAKWLSAKTGHRYRLPSASEWEFAARAGAETPHSWASGGEDACANANVADASAGRRYPGWAVFPCDDGYVYTAPVGAFKANAFGLNDMLGNVLQWTEDCWHENYAGAPIDGSSWTDGDCSLHEIRGGSWFSNPSYVRADYRNRFPADYRTSSAGIRLVRDIGP
jgi:formylglycine-generating enzyme required for sulfatase activity